MITYKLHFLRTGRTSTESVKRYVGQSDPPLCQQGVEELTALQNKFAYPPVDQVFTSPLRRCVETAALLYPGWPTREEPGLMDMHLGRFQGQNFEELCKDEDFMHWLDDSAKYVPPGGEAAADFMRRLVGAVDGIFRYMVEERITSAAVITHGGVIMSLLAGIGLPKLPLARWAVDNGMGYTTLFTPQLWLRDGCAEVFAMQPQPPQAEGQDDLDDF